MAQTEDNPIKNHMPILARNEGIWDGYYRHYDAVGEKIDEHKSRLICRIPEDAPNVYHQTNIYTWEDGRTETRDFPAIYRDGRIWFNNELIDGWAAELDLDASNRTTVLHWRRKEEPGLYFYEIIQLSDCGKKRARTWQWFRNDELSQRTLIDERKISDSWADYA